MKALLLFFFFNFVLSCGNAPTDNIANKVVAITDGDSFTLLTAENKQIKIRLHGIDCPEKNQDFGSAAKQKLSDLIFNQPIRIVEKDVDRYGRTVAIVYTQNDICVNEEMLRTGLAWHYTEYDDNPHWDRLERKAREQNMGLWKQKEPTPPWLWRKERRGVQLQQ